MAVEAWSEIEGTEYSVSDMGRVMSRHRGGRILKPALSKGYLIVTICANGIRKTQRIHTLVAEAFLGPKPTPLHEINHKNGAKIDNRVENLEWVTRSENEQHAYDVLGFKAAYGEANGHAKVNVDAVLAIRDRCSRGETQRVVAADYGITQSAVSRIVSAENWGWIYEDQHGIETLQP